jgi:hypothetical protein
MFVFAGTPFAISSCTDIFASAVKRDLRWLLLFETAIAKVIWHASALVPSKNFSVHVRCAVQLLRSCEDHIPLTFGTPRALPGGV